MKKTFIFGIPIILIVSLLVCVWVGVQWVQAGDQGVTIDTTVQDKLTFNVDSATASLGSLTPGTPTEASTDLQITGNSDSGYVAKALLTGADTTLDLISDAAVNITDKTAWDSGTPNGATWTGTGLGFRVKATSDSDYYNSTWWGADDTAGNALFAGLPITTADTIATCATYKGAQFHVYVGYKIDVPDTQKTGAYDGGVTFSVTANP